ncbi:hypothetical protein MHYP_G00104550 [Metynnis hypsauchen]
MPTGRLLQLPAVLQPGFAVEPCCPISTNVPSCSSLSQCSTLAVLGQADGDHLHIPPWNPTNINMTPIYQNPNPNTNQSDSVYQSLNPNTNQSDSVYQNLTPKTD